MSLPLLRTFLRAFIPANPASRSTPVQAPLPSLLAPQTTYFTPNIHSLKPIPLFTPLRPLVSPLTPRRHFTTSPSSTYARPTMLPRASTFGPQEQKTIEERIDEDDRIVWQNGRWVFKRRVSQECSSSLSAGARLKANSVFGGWDEQALERTLAPAPKGMVVPAINIMSKPCPTTSKAPKTTSDLSIPSSRSKIPVAAARRHRRARRSRNKPSPSKNVESPTPDNLKPLTSAIPLEKNRIKAVPNATSGFPAFGESIPNSASKSTAHPTMRATTSTNQTFIPPTSNPVRAQLEFPPIPAPSHVSSFFDSNRSHLERAKLATSDASPSTTTELVLTSDRTPTPLDAPLLSPQRSPHWTSQILHSQLLHLRTTWRHHYLLSVHLDSLNEPPHNRHQLPRSRCPAPTLERLALLSPRAKIHLPSSPTSFYTLTWGVYQKVYNTGVSKTALKRAERLLKECATAQL